MVPLLLRTYARLTPSGRGAFHLARLGARLLPRRGTFITPDGVRLTLDLSNYPDNCMAHGLYELETARLIRRLLRPGDRFVDCGANIGYFTLHAARWVGEAGRVDAFEPDPHNRRRLIDHLALNGLTGRVTVHAAAVSDTPGQITLYHPPEPDAGGKDRHNHGETTMLAGLIPGSTANVVPAVRVDEAVKASGHDAPVALIKIDVEGAELLAIGGMTGLLSLPRPPAVILEHNPQTSAAAGYAPSAPARKAIAAQPNYKVYWIGSRLAPVTCDDLDRQPKQGNILLSAEPVA